jgi:hypothetical protein
MSDVFISLLLGAGAAGWFYAQLAKRNGNADPKSNFLVAIIGGLGVAVVLFTILKFTFNM